MRAPFSTMSTIYLYITLLLPAMCTTVAESRGIGITHQQVQKSAPAESLATSSPPASRLQAGDEIVAELAPTQANASEAANLVDHIQRQLAIEPNAKLTIHWTLTRPAEVK
jgi:hypothetical protein